MITLNGIVYHVVLDHRGVRMVIFQQSRLIWRVASKQVSLRVLAGLYRPTLA